jgi:flavin reductase (DIM6/NTAB) family NADH-FMN oxidoreductase RutF
MSGSGAFDAKQLRRVLGRWATGVAVMTTTDARGEPRGLTVNSFSSVSVNPPLVLWSIAKSAQSLDTIGAGCVFVVNVLSHRQRSLAQRFAISGGAKFEGVGYRLSAEGAPILEGSAASLVCEATEEHDGGDHVVIIARVIGMAASAEPPLLFVDGAFSSLGP